MTIDFLQNFRRLRMHSVVNHRMELHLDRHLFDPIWEKFSYYDSEIQIKVRSLILLNAFSWILSKDSSYLIGLQECLNVWGRFNWQSFFFFMR